MRLYAHEGSILFILKISKKDFMMFTFARESQQNPPSPSAHFQLRLSRLPLSATRATLLFYLPAYCLDGRTRGSVVNVAAGKIRLHRHHYDRNSNWCLVVVVVVAP